VFCLLKSMGVPWFKSYWICIILASKYTHTLSSFFNTKYPYIRGYYLVILDDRPKSILKVNKNFYDQLQLASTWNRADIAKSKLFKGVSFHSHVSYVVPHPIRKPCYCTLNLLLKRVTSTIRKMIPTFCGKYFSLIHYMFKLSQDVYIEFPDHFAYCLSAVMFCT